MCSTEDIVFKIMIGAIITMALFSFANEYENLFICRLKSLIEFYRDDKMSFNSCEIYKYKCQIKYYNSKIEKLNIIPYLNVLLAIVSLVIILYYLVKLMIIIYNSDREINFNMVFRN